MLIQNQNRIKVLKSRGKELLSIFFYHVTYLKALLWSHALHLSLYFVYSLVTRMILSFYSIINYVKAPYREELLYPKDTHTQTHTQTHTDTLTFFFLLDLPKKCCRV